MQILQILRLCRIFRYLSSFVILGRAIQSKKSEMLVSLEFLGIITLILAFILYFVEHQAQPEVFNNGLTSIMWAFLQYIGDPGHFADTPPITVAGRIIANIIGILTIAIFAVPAGLVASAFTEIMEEDKKEAEYKNFYRRILSAFRFNYDQQYSKLYYCPRYIALSTIVTRKYLSETDIIKTVEKSDSFHLFDLANAVSPVEHPTSKVVVVGFKKNRPYGCCINRNSKVTIVSTSGFIEPVTSWFAYHIAKIGGFNYIAKEIETDLDNPFSYYLVNNENQCPNFDLFVKDLLELSNKPNSWVIPILGAVGTKSRTSQFHFCYAPKNSPTDIEASQTTIDNMSLFKTMYQNFQSRVKEDYELICDENEYYGVQGAKNIERILQAKGRKNIFTLRVETRCFVFDTKSLAYIKTIADVFNQHFEHDKAIEVPNEMRKRNPKTAFSMYGYDDGHDFDDIGLFD